ncbi:MAG: hypothetical protein WA901_11920 [Phormidesmis sp.]
MKIHRKLFGFAFETVQRYKLKICCAGILARLNYFMKMRLYRCLRSHDALLSFDILPCFDILLGFDEWRNPHGIAASQRPYALIIESRSVMIQRLSAAGDGRR